MNQAIGIRDVMADALATGLFVSLCTILALPSPMTLGPSGSPNGTYTAVPGLIDIRCMKAVIYGALGSPLASEHKSMPDDLTSQDWHCLLETYFPTITTEMRASVDGVVYDIVGVDHDSQFQMTRLRLREASL